MTNLDPVDLIVFSPHPDDEVIGCGGILQQALEAGRRVRVVFSTSGDGYPRAAATLLRKPEAGLGPADFIRLGERRRREAADAATALGVPSDRLTFLGYPDGSFDEVFDDGEDEAVVSPFTGLAASPTTGAPYTHAAALRDFVRIVSASQPAEVYTTARSDEHGDHCATYGFVCKAMKATGSTARLFTFMVHSAGDRWPPAGAGYETADYEGRTYPEGVGWPPPLRIPLSSDHEAAKRRALEAHASQWALDHEYLGRFVKSEEVFWT